MVTRRQASGDAVGCTADEPDPHPATNTIAILTSHVANLRRGFIVMVPIVGVRSRDWGRRHLSPQPRSGGRQILRPGAIDSPKKGLSSTVALRFSVFTSRVHKVGGSSHEGGVTRDADEPSGR